MSLALLLNPGLAASTYFRVLRVGHLHLPGIPGLIVLLAVDVFVDGSPMVAAVLNGRTARVMAVAFSEVVQRRIMRQITEAKQVGGASTPFMPVDVTCLVTFALVCRS
jgi:hypothetical protein